MRVSKYQIPTTESGCLLWSVECIYRDGFSLCDDPRTNKGNSDAACHKMANKTLLQYVHPQSDGKHNNR